MRSFDRDYSLFKKEFLKDPFRDEDVVFFDLPESTESQNVETADTGAVHHFTTNEQLISPELKTVATENQPVPMPEEKGVKSVLKNALQQAVGILLVLAVVFVLMNWSALYQIGQSEVTKLFNKDQSSPMEALVGDEFLDASPVLIGTEGAGIERAGSSKSGLEGVDPVISGGNNKIEPQGQVIPPLDLEVAPLDNRIIIPKINKNIPIVRVSSENLVKRDWGRLESDIQQALRNGVVHYPGTSLPGQKGNVVITGHSSYFPWDPGRFKDVFALLHDVNEGDKIVIYYDQKRYVYEITSKEVVLPADVHVLEQVDENKLTLITCTPIGTNLKRLIVTAKQISPLPEEKPQSVTSGVLR